SVLLAALIVATLTAASCGAANVGPAVYVAPDGNDANRGTRTAPVLTLDRAYHLAKPGQIVEVAAGQYAAQIPSAHPTKKSTKHVIFQARRGDTPSFPLIDFGQEQQSIAGPKHVTIKGFAVGLLRAWAGADDVLWQNVDAGYFGIFDATNITLRGGDYGPCVAP